MELLDALWTVCAIFIILVGVFGTGFVCGKIVIGRSDAHMKKRKCSHKHMRMMCPDCGYCLRDSTIN
jgi:hypothetical protein